jgi:exopolysaccharide biosynthesis protein
MRVLRIFPGWRRIAIAVAGILVIAVTAAFVLRERIERIAYAELIHSATGYDVTIDGVDRGGGELVLSGVQARSRGGAVGVTIPRVEVVTYPGERISIVLERPQLALLVDRWRGDERSTLFGGLERLRTEQKEPRIETTVRDGTLTVARGAVPEPAAEFSGVDGSFVHGGSGSYTLNVALADGASRYPIAGTIAFDPDGGVSARWDAAILPLAPLAGVLPPDSPVHVDAGWLEDVSVSYGPASPLRFKGTIEGADVSVQAAAFHRIANLHGDLQLGERSLGSNKIEATLDGIPFEFSGEVGDLHSRIGWITEGTPDLARLGRLMFAVLDQPKLQSLRLESTAPGVAFAQYSITTENGPLAVNALMVDPREPTLRFDTAIAEDHIISNGERTSAMGVRTHAIAGVNGDYFDIGRTYEPQGMLIRSGELLRGPTDRYALIIRRDGTVAFAQFRMVGTATTAHGAFPVTQFNNWPAGDVTVITPDFGKVLPAWPGITFAELRQLSAPGHYVVERVVPMTTAIPIAFGLAFGPRLKGTLPKPGDRITLTYKLDPPADGAIAGIGGGPLLLKDGAWYEDPHAPAPDERDVRWPVIALARLADDTLLLVAVDGRHPETSIGMTRPEFAEMLQRLGANDAMALDSGGSVTLVARVPGDENVSVRNRPSDSSYERWVSDGLFLYSSAPPPEIVAPRLATTPAPEGRPTP